jgi:hypothetical protein
MPARAAWSKYWNGGAAMVVQTGLTANEIIQTTREQGFDAATKQQADRVDALGDLEQWQKAPVQQTLGAVGQFFNPLSSVAAIAHYDQQIQQAQRDLIMLEQAKRENAAQRERMLQRFDKYGGHEKYKENTTRKGYLDLGLEDRAKLLETRDRKERYLQNRERELLELRKERASRWFMTGDLDEKIAALEQRIERERRDVRFASEALIDLERLDHEP